MPDIRLKSIDYVERKGRPLEWSLEGLDLGPVNLLVGKNATGKSRALSIIANLAKIFLREQLSTHEAGYDVVFEDGEKELRYSLRVEEGKVVSERVTVDGSKKLDRDAAALEIYAEEIREFIKFAPSSTEVAAVARRDKLQHPFLLPFRDWAESVRLYHFGDKLGKEHVAVLIKNAKETSEFDDRDENMVVAIFNRGKMEFGDDYVTSVKSDMNALEYDVSGIDTGRPAHMNVALHARPGSPALKLESQLNAIGVCEEGINGTFYQDAISQGMFRALSIIVQVNYSQMANRANCILIDDIGEGLDFHRSSLLIELLRNKARKSKFQLIMATNDQFVMNHVPLEEWSVMQRNGSHVKVRNNNNSRDQFEEFRFVGMSNFAFFEMDFLNGEPVGEGTIRHE